MAIKKTTSSKKSTSTKKKPISRKTTVSKKKATPRKKPSVKRKPKIITTESFNPGTLESIGKVINTNMADMPQIFEKAREAQKIWASYSFHKRRKHILKMRKYIVENAERLAEIVSRDNGKSRIDALATEVIPCALSANWYSKKAKSILKPKKIKMGNILFFNKKNKMIRVPIGVVGIISPWNYPLSIPFGEVIMGLMAGNAIVLKVAAATIMVGKAIDDIVKAGELPDGLFTHIVGSGGQVSGAFFENKVNKIFFTGSVPTGKILMKNAAETLTPLSLELGGKDPMIVLEDADLERAANGAAWAGYQNAGQSCGGVERIYVQESVYNHFIKLMKEKTEKIRHGVDIDFNIEMGAMTTKEQKKIVEDHIKDAVKNGAKVIAQSQEISIDGKKPKGYFTPAVLMTDVNHSMTIMQEETFGPVLPVMKFKTIEEAIELANDSTMALTSSIWTKNTSLGKRIAAKLESGVTTINDHLYSHGQAEAPWGGWKESGLGRTHSLLGLEEMTHAKVINWDVLRVKRNLWWFPFNQKTYIALLDALYFVFPKSIFQKITSGIKMSKFMIKKMFTKWK